MFGHRFFGARFFGQNYFGQSTGSGPTPPVFNSYVARHHRRASYVARRSMRT